LYEIRKKTILQTRVLNIPSSPSSRIYEYKVHDAKARLRVVQSGSYKILAGSTAILKEQGSIPENIKKMRKEFIGNGTVVVDEIRWLLNFQKDIDFNSPSAASSFISGSSTNGWLCFGIPRK